MNELNHAYLYEDMSETEEVLVGLPQTMPIEVRWADVEKSTMLFVVAGVWTVSDVMHSMSLAEAYYDETSADPIHFIVDMHDAAGIPDGLLSSGSLMDGHLRFPEESVTVIVGASRVQQLFARSIIRLGLRVNAIFADDLADALFIIQQYHQSRP